VRLYWWIGLAAFYLVLAWSLAPAELAVAAIAASVGTIGAALVDARVHRPPARAAGRALRGLFTDLLPLLRALAQRCTGRLERVPAQDPALGSLAPATIVVRVEGEHAVVHRL